MISFNLAEVTKTPIQCLLAKTYSIFITSNLACVGVPAVQPQQFTHDFESNVLNLLYM